MKYKKTSIISLPIQLLNLRQTYGTLIQKINICAGELSCRMCLTPSMESDKYTILVKYKISDFSPRAWLLSPTVATFDGKYPPHTYGSDSEGHPQLCVFHPAAKEWTQQMFLSESFIPWIVTWLNTYEYWQITGEWNYPAATHTKKKV